MAGVRRAAVHRGGLCSPPCFGKPGPPRLTGAWLQIAALSRRVLQARSSRLAGLIQARTIWLSRLIAQAGLVRLTRPVVQAGLLISRSRMR